MQNNSVGQTRRCAISTLALRHSTGAMPQKWALSHKIGKQEIPKLQEKEQKAKKKTDAGGQTQKRKNAAKKQGKEQKAKQKTNVGSKKQSKK